MQNTCSVPFTERLLGRGGGWGGGGGGGGGESMAMDGDPVNLDSNSYSTPLWKELLLFPFG